MFNMYDSVRVTSNDKKHLTIKEGLIVGLTSSGAKVYHPRCKGECCDHPYTDSMQFSEWFPFNSKAVKMTAVKSRRKNK